MNVVEEEKVNIAEVAVFSHDHALKEVYQHSSARLERFEQVYLRLCSKDLLVSYAEVRGNCQYVTHETRQDIIRALKEKVIPLIKKNNNRPIKEIVSKLATSVASCGARTLMDVTLHVLGAKQNGVPLCEYLGEKELEEVRGYCGVPFADLKKTGRIAKEGLEAGFTLFKVRVGLGPREKDCERVQFVREIVGEKEVAIDANGAWSVQEAIENINSMSCYKLSFAEQPVQGDDIRGMKIVRENVDAPIMADESLMSIDSFDKLVSEDALDMANIKILKAGGLSNASKIIEMANGEGIPFCLGSMSTGRLDAAATLHVQASIGADAKYFSGGGFGKILNDPTGGLKMRDGKLKVPSAPGLGVKVDETALQKEFLIRL